MPAAGEPAPSALPAQPAAGTPARSAADPARPPAIELRGITKLFGEVRANQDVSLVVSAGTVHGIVGENGAGKSTLMSILYGFYEADAGEILVAGRPLRIRTPEDAIAAGIGMVHQHFMLVEPFTVLENVVLGAEGGALLAPGKRKARAELLRLAAAYGLEIDPDAVVGELAVGLQQRVEILKALFRGARILILDEPTGVLTPQEVDRLFQIFAALRDQGVTVILITHKLREIMAVTDAVSVMRGGCMVAQRRTAETSKEELAELMVGRKVLLRVAKGPAHPGQPALAIEHLGLTDENGIARLDDVSLSLREGEILGIAGVSGNGQSELLEVLSGIRPFTAGRIILNGHEVTRARPADPETLRLEGLAHVPEDRLRRGLVKPFSAAESAILGYHRDAAYNGAVLLHRTAVRQACARAMADYDVRPPDPGLKTANFSGGNQQKLVLARELARQPNVLLVGQPTRGVDVGAIEFIHRSLIAMRDAGHAILLVSAELDEILSLADRILVMFAGRVVGELPAAAADERTLGLMMANILPEREPAAPA